MEKEYYKFFGGNGYCGCEYVELMSFDKGSMSKQELDCISSELCQENADDYSHVAFGWGGDTPTKEEWEEYYKETYGSYEKISKKEFDEYS